MVRRKYDITPVHWTFKTSDRVRDVNFFKDVLGMKILSHLESGRITDKPFSGSRTVMGYGPRWFALELLYAYGGSSHETSKDLLGITIVSKAAIARAKALDWPIDEVEDKLFRLVSPQGNVFYLVNDKTPTDCDPIKEICLISSLLFATVNYWQCTFGVTIFNEDHNQVTLSFGEGSCKIRFVEGLNELSREPGYGYVTLSMPKTQLELLEYRSVEENKQLVTLHSVNLPHADIPCHVLVFTVPDEYQVVFVEEEAYSPLCKTDPNAGNSFDLAIQRSERASKESGSKSLR